MLVEKKVGSFVRRNNFGRADVGLVPENLFSLKKLFGQTGFSKDGEIMNGSLVSSRNPANQAVCYSHPTLPFLDVALMFSRVILSLGGVIFRPFNWAGRHVY